jgi:hypothetical protein
VRAGGCLLFHYLRVLLWREGGAIGLFVKTDEQRLQRRYRELQTKILRYLMLIAMIMHARCGELGKTTRRGCSQVHHDVLRLTPCAPALKRVEYDARGEAHVSSVT